MTRNYTEVIRYLSSPVDMGNTLSLIENARSETWRNGWSTRQLEEKRRTIGRKRKERIEEIREKIGKIDDPRLRIFLDMRFVQNRDYEEIKRKTGWNDKFVRHIHERALMNMEIVLVEDGVLTFVDPKADIMRDYEDGFKEGLAAGRKKAYSEGREDGYSEGKREGHAAGYSEGRNSGYNEGLDEGRIEGFNAGYEHGYANRAEGLPIYHLAAIDDNFDRGGSDDDDDDDVDDDGEYEGGYDDDDDLNGHGDDAEGLIESDDGYYDECCGGYCG